MPALLGSIGLAAALPARGALLALDVGKARIGVAVSDAERRQAFPLTVIARVKFTLDAKAILKLAAEREVGGLIVGLPLNMDGSMGPQAQSVESFARHLKPLTELPIGFVDERLSTVAADDRLIAAGARAVDRRRAIDAHAAAEILERALRALGSA